MWVYIRSEPSLWTVGFYQPDGEWVSESDHDSPDDAAERCAWLNGNRHSSERQAVPVNPVDEAEIPF